MAITKDNTDLRWSGTLFGQFADVVDNLLRRRFEPGGNGATIWDSGGTDTLSFAVKTTHVAVR